MNFPALPAILTEADWNKHKGTIAKLAGETGIGAAMKDLKTAYDNIDPYAFSVSQAYPDEAAIDAAEKRMRDEASKVEVLRQKALTLSKLASTTETKFKANKLIPKSSTQHVQKIQAEIMKFTPALKGLDGGLKELEQARVNHQKMKEMVIKAVKTYITKVETGAKRVAANPTPQEFQSFWSEEIRGMAAAIARTPSLAPTFSPRWKQLSTASYVPGPDGTPEDIRAKLKEVVQELIKVKQAAG
jgi:hypothetical protein